MSDNLKVAKECGATLTVSLQDRYWVNTGGACFEREQLEAYTSRILSSQQVAHDAEIAKLKEEMRALRTECAGYMVELIGANEQLYAANAACAMNAEEIESLVEDWDDLLEDLELHGMHKFEPYIRSKAKMKTHAPTVSVTKQQVSEWERKQLEPLRAQVAMLVTALSAAWSEDFHLHHHYCAQLRDKALSNTQATADQFIAECEQRGAFKALDMVIDICESEGAEPNEGMSDFADGYDVACKEISEQVKLIRATSKKAG